MRKVGLPLLVVLASSLVLAGCMGGGLIAWGKGWSPTAVASSGDKVTVFVGTRDGELMALDVNREQELWRITIETVGERSGSLLGLFGGGREEMRGVFGPPAVGAERVYVGVKGDSDGENGKIYAVNRDGTGVDWSTPIDGGIVGGLALAEAEGLVLVGSDDGNLYAFDTTSGVLIWSFPTGDQIWSTPVVRDGIVYFGSMDRNVYALALGDELDQESRLLWKYRTGGSVVAIPLLLDQMVIIGSVDKKLYALDSRDGQFLWSFPTDGWLWAGAVSDGKRIYASTMAGSVYALSKDGRPAWGSPFNAESPIVSTPVIVDDRIVVGTDGRKLYLLSTDSGEGTSLHLESRVKAPLSKQGDKVFVGLEADEVIIVDVQTREARGVEVRSLKEVWHIPTKRLE